ncbi:fibronectin type III domain-containing protein 5-like [Branchiostoma floridae]|uniref:Fibronectin type III domain-containing protein 5-like n=1 Tax=Branchiostoma floridae TaxID=7739 RepID=A0A9J7M8P1_BRAFL|nr:fibronectin type III domain-containing protein 5-like [Branchiostoma floridae]
MNEMNSCALLALMPAFSTIFALDLPIAVLGLPSINVTIDDITAETATIVWKLKSDAFQNISGFEIVARFGNKSHEARTITEVGRRSRSLTLTYLKPSTRYVVTVAVLYADYKRKMRSNNVTFRTPTYSSFSDDLDQSGDSALPNDDCEVVTPDKQGQNFTIEEWVIIALVLVVWASVIVLFLRQWDAIRSLQPRDISPRPPTPKEISEFKTITIVENEKDTLIRTTRF